MPDHPGRLPGIVLIATAIFLGSCPAAWAQRDVDRVVKEAMDAWKEGSPAWREQAFQLMTSLGRDARPLVPLLVDALRDPSPLVRARAAALLGGMGFAAKESVFALAALLKDPEAEVRDAAAMALAQLGRRAECAVGAMVESSRAPPDRRCLKATLALASIGEPAVPALIGLLKADDPAVRRAVIQGIEDAVHAGCWHECGAVARTIGTHYQSLARDPDPGVRFALASMLVLTRSDSPLVLSALGQLLSDPDSDVRLAVATSVGKYSWLPAGLRGSFLELLKDGELDVRVAAARAVPQPDLVAPVVIDRLLAALKDPDPRVRAAAAVKLAEARYTAREMDSRRRPVATVVYTSAALSHHPAAGRILTSALEDSRLEARVAAAHLLPALPAEAAAAIPRLKERLKDTAPAVRAAAAEALAELGPASRAAERALLGILANPDDGSQEAIIRQRMRPEARAIEANLGAGPQEGRLASFNAARALASIGGDARAKMLRLLTGQLNSLDEGIRERAEQIVVGLGPGVVGDLLRILADPKSPRHVQVEAQGLLFTLHLQNEAGHLLAARPPRPEVRAAMPVLRSLSRDADPEVRITTLALLAAVDPRDASAAELYLDYLRSGMDPDLNDQWLGQVIKPAMIPTLIKGLKDPDHRVRFATASVLANLAERNPVVEEHAADDRQLRIRAARALLSSLKDRDVRVRWVAAQTLGVLEVEAKAVIPALIEMAETEAVRVPTEDFSIHSFQDEYLLAGSVKGGDPLRIAAIRALGGFGREAAGAVPQLVRALRDDDLRVRWFAAEALALIGPDAKAAVPALLEGLRSRDVATGQAEGGSGEMADGPIRLMAAYALGRIGPEARAAIPELIAALSGPDSRVRCEAAQALGLIGPEARAAIPELRRLVTRGTVADVSERAAEALGRLGSVAIPALVEMLHDGDPEIRAKALEIFGRMDAKTAVPIAEIVRCLRDRDADVRRAAAVALGTAGRRAGAAAAVPGLVIALWDQEAEIADSARIALIVIAKPVLPAMLTILHAVYPHPMEPGDNFESVVIPLAP